MGSDKYVYFPLEGAPVSAADLEELAADTGGTDLSSLGSTLVARLPAESSVRESARWRVWYDPRKMHLFDPGNGRNLTRLAH